MKLRTASIFLPLLLAGCTACSAPATPSAAPKAAVAPVVQNKVKLQLPPAIYAVPGIETNIYFDNVVCVINPDNYVFDIKCTKGRNDQKRWRYTPKAGEEGIYGLELTVISNAGVEAVGTTKLIVTSAEAGKGKNFGILILGDSLTAASVYPSRLHELLTANGHPQVKFLGTYGRKGTQALHEGYGGWKWSTFLTKTAPTKVAPGGKTFPRHRASPFLFDGKFSLAQYLKKNHNGRVPDFITIQLGVNDVFGATDANQQRVIDTILDNADKLIANLRKDAPNAIIGVGLVTPGARTQDAFGSNYACGQTRWQYKKNQHALNAAMLKKFASYPDKKVFLVPSNVNLDCENNYPVRREAVNGVLVKGARNFIIRQSNGVHPAPAGYNQMGDTFYCWIKYQLSR
ncbi:MAG: hypothetical protein IKD44_11815 [Lentisphaeria bacterium]|nr:hypothetical protein [Lentisphaeria bacterium]